ncbi:MAG: phosphatase PAP2 family protein [Deltaproteobacteria bacterium]|nr:phosphatase PAP2 family protein [Deltaproteobacteria bacterium]MBI4794705.1 phosphatase PAP2 family protein [Deltaproteobacteria bacterium]
MVKLETLNRTLFLKINAGPAVPAWIINGATLIANYLIYLIPIILLGMWLWGDEPRRSLALKACLVSLLGVSLNQIIGLAWQHPRPFMLGLGHNYLTHAPDSSFPSDHVTIFAGIGLSLLLGGAGRLAFLTLTAGAAVAWARVFLGVHFPLDMLGAVGIACGAFAVVMPIWWKAGSTMTRLSEQLYRKVLARLILSGWIRY